MAAKAAKSSSSSLYFLIGVLVVLGIIAAIEFRARFTAQGVYNQLVGTMPDDDALPVTRHAHHTLTAEQVHELIGMEPSEVQTPPTGLREVYHWQGLIRSYKVYVYYQPGKPSMLHHVELNSPPPAP